MTPSTHLLAAAVFSFGLGLAGGCTNGSASSTAASADGAGQDDGGADDAGNCNGARPDGPAWAVTPELIDYGALQNAVPGGIPLGTSRSASLQVVNTSKKTPLTLASASIEGANAADFVLDGASLATALATTLPPNKCAASTLEVTFTAGAEGSRSATLVVVTDAGTTRVPLAGAGLPSRPVAGLTPAAIRFGSATQMAPATVTLTNDGGVTLVLQSLALSGPNAASFQFVSANHALSNCHDGVALAPHATCYIGVWFVQGMSGSRRVDLIVKTNDPLHPTIDVPITLAL